MGFQDHLADLDEAVADVLGDPARLRQAGGDLLPDPVRVILELPIETAALQEADLIRSRPTLEVSVADAAVVRKDDVFELNGRCWKVLGKPGRPGDGRWWLCDVADVGPVA